MFASRRISTPIVGKREMALSRMRTAAGIISRCGATNVEITQVLGGYGAGTFHLYAYFQSMEHSMEVSNNLMNDVAFYDEDRKIMWFPSVVNMGKMGVIYPEGTKNNWTYKLAQVRQLSEVEQKEERYKGHTEILDVENAKEYGQYDFLDACREMGIVKDL